MINRIRELREAHGLTQEELAERLRCHPSTISRLESENRQLTRRWMQRISQALGVDARELLIPGEPLEAIADMVASNALKGDATYHSAAAVLLATLTLVIDQCGVSIQDAVRRIEHVHQQLPDQFRSPEATERITLLIDWLRAHDVRGEERWTRGPAQAWPIQPPTRRRNDR